MTEALSDKETLPPDTWLVLGLGRTGLSCARYLKAQGRRVAVADTRQEPPERDALRTEMPDVPLLTGPFSEPMLASAARLVVSPGIDLREPAIQAAGTQGVPVLGDVTLFSAARDAPLIAVTGSNGKSTVVSLIGAMAEAAGWRVRIGGNLGPPALDLLQESREWGRPDLYVLELSSFQLELVRTLRADVAVVLNVSADHMDRYPDLPTYAATKARIFNGARRIIRNADDPRVMAMVTGPAEAERFALDAEADYCVTSAEGQTWLAGPEGAVLPTSDMPLAGRHNQANALAAMAASAAVGMPVAALRAGLMRFRGLRHRMVAVAEIDGVTWYDDSKATNVGAAAAALRGMTDPVILLAGGQGKNQDFAPLAEAARGRVRRAFVFGEDGPTLAAALGQAVPVEQVASLPAAVERAAGVADPGDAVLLSPACASFDQFQDYGHRGDVFAHAVKALRSGRRARS